MPKIAYEDRKFTAKSLVLIDQANAIISEYESQGFALTLRQLYYQFVSRGLIPNNQREYKKLGSVINDARLSGLIDWNHITDRTRQLRSLAHWNRPDEIVRTAAQQYRRDMWTRQDYRPEVWIEKDALIGVIESVCQQWDVPYFSCRGYTSQSEMWVAAQRLEVYSQEDQTPVILHFGDHDPSGKDMTRDIVDRLDLFIGDTVDLKRLALNMDQIDKYKPPPNPAKFTDSRVHAYVAEFGTQSWELDALEPKVIVKLITDNIQSLINPKLWQEDRERIADERKTLEGIADKLEDGKDV